MAKIKPRLRTHADGATSWHVVIETTRDSATGKRRQQRITARTKRECEQRATAELAKVQRGEYVSPSKETVGEYLDRWLAAVEPSVEPTTHRGYTAIARHYIVPALGNLALDRLTPLHLQELYAQKGKTLAPGTIGQIHRVAHVAFGQAVRWRLLSHNPADGAKAPSVPRGTATVWNADQARRFLVSAIEDEAFAALWRLALSTGMRKGELLAMRWVDIDLERAVLAVPDAKTPRGRRSIALDAGDVAVLRTHREYQEADRERFGVGWPDHELVFCRDDGRLWRAHVLNERLDRYATDLALPRLTFHQLRHTAITLMMEAGIPVKVISERVGHAGIAITLDRYSHVLPHMQTDAAGRIGAILDAAKTVKAAAA